jgi:cobalamin biosynthesis protein CobD/CbiB
MPSVVESEPHSMETFEFMEYRFYYFLYSTGRSNHLEERGCANRKSVDTICNRVKQNFPPEDVICAVCETDLCNSSQRSAARLLYLMFLGFVTIIMYTA